MASAPRVSTPDRLLVIDEFTDGGEVVRAWKLVYWLDAFDGRPAGWHAANCGDLRNPVGWVCALPGGVALDGPVDAVVAGPVEYELLIDTDDDALLAYGGAEHTTYLHVLVTGQTAQECRSKLRNCLAQLKVVPFPGKAGHARELEGYLAELAKKRQPEGYRMGGNRTVSYQLRAQPDIEL